MIEVYAIADHPGPPLPDVNGVRAVPAGRIAALCAEVEETELSPPRCGRTRPWSRR